jgi:hypothetical protein
MAKMYAKFTKIKLNSNPVLLAQSPGKSPVTLEVTISLQAESRTQSENSSIKNLLFFASEDSQL